MPFILGSGYGAVMDKDFRRVADRAAALRKTESEIIKEAGVADATWWRAREGKVGLAARVRTLRVVEAKLDELEKGVTA